LKDGFQKYPYQHTLFVKFEKEEIVIICLYVHDIIFTRDDTLKFNNFKISMMDNFEMTYRHDALFLAIQVVQWRIQ